MAIRCKVCGSELDPEDEIIEPIVHHGATYICEDCGARFCCDHASMLVPIDGD